MMTARRDDYTAPVEDYLKAIYELERSGGAAATTEIAQRLAIAPASVSGSPRGPITCAGRIFWFSIITSSWRPVLRRTQQRVLCPHGLCHCL